MPPNNMMPPQQPYGPRQQITTQPPPQQYVAASQQKPHRGGTIFLIILLILLLLGASGFGVWAFLERQDYKNNVDEKIAAAVEVASQEVATEKDNEFLEREKRPFKQYQGPSTFGGVDITYPRNWSAFVTETDRGNIPIDGFFHPNFVPGEDSGTQFALRMQVTNKTYDNELQSFNSAVKGGRVTVSPYKSAKVPDVLGSRIEGEIQTGQQQYMVMFPVRDKTLKIWTEAERFKKDLDEIILPNIIFTP